MPAPAGTGPWAPDPALYDVTFVALDVETTGGSPDAGELVEVGAAVFRGGECLATFESMVNPGCEVPPFVCELTGITQAMADGAPRLELVIPELMAVVGDGVVVGHNVEFDMAFVDAALARCGRPPLANISVDTLALARRLVRDCTTSCSLHSLAGALHLAHRPSHRALSDAMATADLLHRLIEAATGFGVLRLGDLVALPERLAPMPRGVDTLLAV